MEFFKEINKKAVLKYLGYRGGDIEEGYLKKIDNVAREVMEEAVPKVCAVKLKIISHEPLRFENSAIELLGDDIKKHLDGCDECVFMAATLGSGIDRLITKKSVTDMAEAVIYDACASSAIEALCDGYTKELERLEAEKGFNITERFSPGYGDLPIESQKDFCTVLNTQKNIGLFHNRAMMLEPVKSVTAVIGITREKCEKRRKECENCRLFFDCDFRKRGVTCYEQSDK